MIMVRATIKKRKKASFHLAFTPWLSNRLQSFTISAYTKKFFSSYLLDQMCGNFVSFCCVICFFKSKIKDMILFMPLLVLPNILSQAHTKTPFETHKVSGKRKKMLRKIIFSSLVLLWKTEKKIKYNQNSSKFYKFLNFLVLI